MKNRFPDHSTFCLHTAFTCLKFIVLALCGLAIAFVISHIFEITAIMQMLLSSILWAWIARFALSFICICAIAIVYESSR